ncbi:MAG: polysaccharide ABC transporter ATP-binding protein [Thermoanaerobaculia bacterium]
MPDVVIRAEGLGKRYLIGHLANRERYSALRDTIARGARAFARKTGDLLHGRPIIQGDEIEEIWALRDLDFEIRRGELVGIIGRNGAGKSTLLKILSRITEPSVGRVQISGRVASLLEVGTGFHLELSGRENIFLNGAILGMSRAEIRRKFDEIVAFAEVEKFLDTPVKRYSSGMYVRLAFAVAAHLEPEILIIDEVLAVGDAEFQKKCLGRMSEVARGGRTVLFVSHNMGAVQALCSRGILLSAGRLLAEGSVSSIVESYLAGGSHSVRSHEAPKRELSDSLNLEKLLLELNPAAIGGEVTFAIEFTSTESLRVTDLSILIYSELGVRVAIVDLRMASSTHRVSPIEPLKISGQILDLPLVEGTYSIGLFIACGELRGDFHELTTLEVIRPTSGSELAPYASRDRGFLDLRSKFHVG